MGLQWERTMEMQIFAYKHMSKLAIYICTHMNSQITDLKDTKKLINNPLQKYLSKQSMTVTNIPCTW